MISRIDWLSFSFGFDLYTLPDSDEPVSMSAIWSLSAVVPEHVMDIVLSMGYEPCNGRPPYSGGLRAIDGGWSLYFNPVVGHAVMEISGRGCETLHNQFVLLDLLAAVADKATRIDLACDWLTDVKPSEFAESRGNDRFKAIGTQVSETGETIYIGSRKSERYTRVYRYNPPHPRHEFLRCEMVFRKQQAKIAAMEVVNNGIDIAVSKAGNIYQWTHKLWSDTTTSDAEMAAWRPERRQSNTVRWLITQVAPAIVKLANDDAIDLIEFLGENVLPFLKPEKRDKITIEGASFTIAVLKGKTDE